jgi:hypothetical protein
LGIIGQLIHRMMILVIRHNLSLKELEVLREYLAEAKR